MKMIPTSCLRLTLVYILGLTLSLASPAPGLTAQEPAPDDARMEWWREARFGLFIHWGLYAIPAGQWGDETGHGEWIMNTAQIPVDQYEQYVDQFNPVKFDADEWARMAKNAGMKYIVITSKHHDGFCLFDSKQTEYDVMSTPFQRDIMKELSEACARHGLKMCWYHSIMDWHHPDYLPRRGWEKRPIGDADFDRYVTYLRNQVTELLTNYGEIGVMWFDGQWEGTWTHAYGQPLYDLCRALQPQIIVNDRVDKGRKGHSGVVDNQFAGDFGTPEQHIPATGLPGVDWETCMTMNRHWGYNQYDDVWKSTEDLIHKLVDIASKNGNFLLNVGPKADGTFPEESVVRLREIGDWMATYGDSIYGTSASCFSTLPFDGRCTVKRMGDQTRLFLHIFEWPENSTLRLSGLGNRIVQASLLGVLASNLRVTQSQGEVEIHLPKSPPDEICSVVAVDIDGEPIVYEAPSIETNAKIFVRPLTVRIESSSTEIDVHYTVDESTPTLDSPRYTGPFQIGESTTVKAASFHEGRRVSGIVKSVLERVTPEPGRSLASRIAGLNCEVFEGDWDTLPEFDALEPIRREIAALVELPSGPAAEYQGRRFSGYLHAPADDVYLFALNSDDGSRMLLGDRVVIDNDGLHGPETQAGYAALGAGWHPITVEYFNKTGGAALALQWARLGDEYRPIPPSALARPGR